MYLTELSHKYFKSSRLQFHTKVKKINLECISMFLAKNKNQRQVQWTHILRENFLGMEE